MYSKVYSAAIRGIEMEIVAVETDVSDGLPSFEMVGLLNSEVKEARERVRSAIKNTGYLLPPKRITVNLSPADIRKEGSSFDLPIAISILTSLGLINKKINAEDKILIAGELSLSGKVMPMNGVLPMVLAAREKGIKKFIVPKDNAKEGAVVKDVEIYGITSLQEVINFLNGYSYEKEPYIDFDAMYESKTIIDEMDFADISGQESVKRAIKVAVAGMHHVLMIGTPGSGKSMIAKRIPGILPKPDMEECMEITKIHSIAGELKNNTCIRLNRPFRAPHHSVSDKALIGGGNNPKPGEITLAHRGVLFLDELAEFRRETIDSLRQPLETGEVVINRLNGTYVFPASVMLVAATNPCKCGYYPDRNRCSCTEIQVKNYLGKISGPILDRIDMCITTQTVMLEDIGKKTGESSAKIRQQIEKVRKIQEERYEKEKFRFNSEVPSSKLDKYCKMSSDAKNIIEKAYKMYGLSVRSYHKLVRVARTIADLEGANYIEEKHIAEALGYRAEIA